MQIKYGIQNNNIDITNICLTKLLQDNIITIPSNDYNRSYFFTDPIFGTLKKIFINIDDDITEYDDTQTIKINVDSKIITILNDITTLNDTNISSYKNTGNFITFIIPSIGRETLSRTIKSLENQTLGNWKAIIVFDGIKSTISVTDDRISIIETEKKGISFNSAGNVRNVALKQVYTKWVGFVDDDDTLAEDYVECLYKNTTIFKDVNTFIFRMAFQDGIILPKFEDDNFYINNVGISFAVKTKFYKNKNLYFTPGETEDFYYLDTIRNLNEHIIILENIGYYVRCNPFKIDKNFKNVFVNYPTYKTLNL